ncbi:AAA ATPase midasin [Microbotryomycetes sp. JL201]|nr:AAA ATPase midasin [Microbotryomycetes sp. JL201]
MDLDPVSDPGDASGAAPAAIGASLASFDISLAVGALLKHLRVLDTDDLTLLELEHGALTRPEYLAHEVWVPLIAMDDVSALLSTLAPSSVPSSVHDQLRPLQPTRDSRRHVLDTIARLALQPSLTLVVASLFKPVSAHLWGRWLDMLGLTSQGEWPASTDSLAFNNSDKQAVETVYVAMVKTLPVYDSVFPYLTTLLRHPLLSTPPVPEVTATAEEAAGPLLALYSLLHTMPQLPTAEYTASFPRLPWSLPTQVESIMKRHPHRGTRLLAWHIVRRWYAMFGSDGQRLRDAWVGATGSLSVPMPDYPIEHYAEFQQRFGPFQGEKDEQDILFGWEETLTGHTRFVQGGLEVCIRRRAVDPWILPAMHDIRRKSDEAAARMLCKLVSSSSEDAGRTGYIGADELSQCVVDVEGILMFREGFIPSIGSLSTDINSYSTAAPSADLFVRTPTTSDLLQALAQNVQQRMPVLVTSPPSSGKMSTITHLWNVLHASPTSSGVTAQARKRGLVVINLADRSLDSKSLLGSLSSAPTSANSTAGTFTFVEGPLTRAMRQGRWVVLTSIDQASVEILTVIKIVVERMKTAALSAVGGAWGGGADEESGGVGIRIGGGDGGKWVKAGKGFMLFATRSTESSTPASFFASHFWTEVTMPALTRSEVEAIVKGRHPRLEDARLVNVLIEGWEKIKAINVHDGNHGGINRPIGVRDLMRWARRVDRLVPRDVKIESIASNPTLQEEIFVESRDVFLGSIPAPPSAVFTGSESSRDKYSLTARILAEVLELSEERAEYILRRRVPDFVEPNFDDEDEDMSSQQHHIRIGRVSLPLKRSKAVKTTSRTFAYTNPSLIVLEKLGVCVRLSEPVLMVGETGTGKTTAVQHLADKMGKSLTALNLSNQTEAGDLIGGYRPIDEAEEARRTAAELVNKFVDLFGQTFNAQRNAEYVSHVRKAFDKKRWSRLVGLWREAARMAEARIAALSTAAAAAASNQTDAPRKRRKLEAAIESLPSMWTDFMALVGEFDVRHVQKTGKGKFVFSFVEGPLAKAIRNGDWVLLDEVNLASAETLESLSTLLQAPDSSLVLSEQGDLEPIPRHAEFRLFACMNPATDVGKRDLPSGLRAKFSEIWVPPPDEDRDALVKIIEGYVGRHVTNDLPVVGNVADLYTAVKALAMSAQLSDGANQAPHFSMRTLARALTFAAEFADAFGHLRRSLYEGFLMSFTMLLDPKSQEIVSALIVKHIVEPARNAKSLLKQRVKRTSNAPAIFIEPYWLETGDMEPMEPKDYILTASVQRKVADLARAVLTRKVPVLIQGPTSAGKTSVVEYLAKRTGHRFVRINNHEHTDIQEYIGTYVSDPDSGKLVFQEGVLVRALRRGDWIVLDELNLAPTDVLEALNRLLDDNRELVIPETGEVVRPHPHFMLFATQNPPGLYGGRKVLSRAFRNRFLEMHFGDVPQNELETILCERCAIAPSYAKKTVGVFLELQRRRQAGRVFEQKQAFATLRDLFRWGGRGSVGYQQLAEDGYMLLAERARRADDKVVVKEVIESEMKVKIDEFSLYNFERLDVLGLPDPRQATADLVWTGAMRRLYFLIAAALHRDEPVLLVGETGAGKTSVCQALAAAVGRRLHIVGCHQNTETADLLGGQRPLRNRAAIQAGLLARAKAELADLNDDDFDIVLGRIESQIQNTAGDDRARLEQLVDDMRKSTALFEWHDGPLVQAMRDADLILLDEISLADDSVLERLNSVLEPSRTLVLAEKGGRDLDDIRIVGQPGFKILATMNPGGDFGKKELSPALRNRFTEIWVPAVDDLDDLSLIISSRWSATARQQLEPYGPKMLDFAKWLGAAVGMPETLGIGLRDILGWIDFLNNASRILGIGEASSNRANSLESESSMALALPDAFCQGALMSVVDGLGALPATSGLSKDGLDKLRSSCWRFLESLVDTAMAPEALPLDVSDVGHQFAVGPFSIKKGSLAPASVEFTLLAPTTKLNAMRLLRALQLKKPVLLEGSPGVGKTSLVTALAAATGHNLVRINLSDQTDLMDLLGSDLPVEGGKSGEFAWKDAPFLAAMQHGDWVLLDEMNLASQSILEGLNSCLDHRGAVYIPELDRTFNRHPDFRIFAAQNPLGQGGGRKGLPRSFLDRFSVVHMEELNSVDLNAIARSLYPEMDVTIIEKMVAFNTDLHRQTMDSRKFGLEGSPWEFNLRDVLRWLSLIKSSTALDAHQGQAIEYFGLLYLQRFRNAKDRNHVAQLFELHFGQSIDPVERPWPAFSPDHAQFGHSLIKRQATRWGNRPTMMQPITHSSLQPLESLVKTIDMGWLAILTGPRDCGKTTLARQVAALVGRRLHEFSMSAEVDTLELLGSFEQTERTRDFDRLIVSAIRLVEESILTGLGSNRSLSPHAIVNQLRQRRDDLAASDVDLVQLSQSLKEALEAVASAIPAVQDVLTKLDTATSAPPAAARFEWVDGPLVQALKHGDWLLIEDANLCSPSVLDRLNSLFENGGRLQLAERGPVNGEIEIIDPHPDFRMIMTLDPRNGELSRAMRNRGIEIAMLDERKPESLLGPINSNALVEPDLTSLSGVIEPAWINGDDDALTVNIITGSSPRHFGLILRLQRALQALPNRVEFAMRELERQSTVQQIQYETAVQAQRSAVPSFVFESQVYRIGCPLDALAALFSSTFVQPTAVAAASSKSIKSLTVWEKSLLLAHGKFRQGEEDQATVAVYPLARALVGFVSRTFSAALAEQSPNASQSAVAAGVLIQRSIAELKLAASSRDFDYSTVQHVVEWISAAVEALSSRSVDSNDVAACLAPLQQSLTLTSGQAMANLWKAFLVAKSLPPALMEAYNNLLARASDSDATQWEKATGDLFQEVAVSFGLPQVFKSAKQQADAVHLINSLTSRIPPTSAESTESAAVRAFEASGYSVAELAAISQALTGATHPALAAFLAVARHSNVSPLTRTLAVAQSVAWSESIASKTALELKAMLSWSENLALGLDGSLRSPASLLKPILLRSILEIKSDGSATLGTLTQWRNALLRAAKTQLGSIIGDRASRAASLQAIISSAIVKIVVAAQPGERFEFTGDGSTTSVHMLCENVALCDEPVREALSNYLGPTLSKLGQQNVAMRDIALSYIGFARMLWHLYFPSLPLDPAVGFQARARFVGRQLFAMQALFQAVQTTERSQTGNDRNKKLERLAQEVQALEGERDSAVSFPVAREGNLAMLAGLFQELRGFQQQVITDKQLDDFIGAALQSITPEVVNRETNLQRSIDTLLRRLRTAYVDMDDILDPIRLSLCSLKIGMALLVQAQQLVVITKAYRNLGEFASHVVSFPRAAHVTAIESQELPLSLKLDEALVPASLATMAQLSSLTDRISRYGGRNHDELLRVKQMYDRLHHLWITDRKREEQAAREAESIYKSKTNVQEIKTDEEIEAAEFAELFPTYDEATEDEVSNNKTNDLHGSSKPKRFLQPSEQSAIVHLHLLLFSRGYQDVRASGLTWDSLRDSVVSTLLPKLFDVLGDDIDRSSAAWRIETLVHLIKSGEEATSAADVRGDFYTESNVPETSKATPVLQAFAKRLSDLIATWPEQMVLQTLLDRCNSILAFTASSPIAKILTALEQLLSQTEDWETYASREHSVAADRSAIIELIVRWRRLELSCWSKLLDGVQQRFADTISEWWFRFYETVIQGALETRDDEERQQFLRELVTVLDSFLSSSSVGQFSARLELAASFANFASVLGQEFANEKGSVSTLDSVGRLVNNVVSFYDQYSPAVKMFIAAERGKVDKEVKNVIKLASWKDINVYALRQSAIKSHHMLYKQVRKLRTVLQQPASDFFRSVDLSKAVGFSANVVELDLSFAAEAMLPNPQFGSLHVGQHIQQLDLTLKRLSNLFSAKIDPQLVRNDADIVENLATQIISTAKALREESTDGEEEGKEQRIKALATRKRRAWIELLRELKRLGLSPSPPPDVVKRLSDPAYIYSLSTLQSIIASASEHVPETVRAQLRRVDEYHFKLVSDLPALHKCPAEHSDDISTREVQRAVGSIESGLSLAMQHRNALHEALHAQLALQHLVDRFDVVSAHQSRLSAHSAARHSQHDVAAALFVMEETVDKLSDYRKLAGAEAVDCSSVDHIVTLYRSKLVDLHSRLTTTMDNMFGLKHSLATTAERKLVDDANSCIENLRRDVVEATCPDSLVYLLEPLQAWAAGFGRSDMETPLADLIDLSSLFAAHAELIDSVLVIAQDLKRTVDLRIPTAPDMADIDEVPDQTLKKLGRALQDVLGVFRLPQLLQRAGDFDRQCHKALASADEAAQQQVQALIQRVSPFVRLVSTEAHRLLQSFLNWHKSSLKLSHVLISVVIELCASGFCKPADSSGQGEEAADGKTSDGTGMADGQGAKNVSNEIEDESQVEGLQNDVQQEKNEQGQEKDEGEDDAIEMSADFEGDLEDRGDGEKDEKEDGDSDEEEEEDQEPEEQVADVDPLDPSTVDEKFWGDEEEDGKDQKDGPSNEQVNQETKQAGESEMTAKDEEGGPPKPRGDDAKEQASEEEQKDAKEAESAADMEQDAELDEHGKEDEPEGEEGEADGEQQDGDQVQDDQVDRIDNGMPEADNLDLPDDMNMDGEDKKDDEGEGEDDDDLGDLNSLPDDKDGDEGEQRRDELDEIGESRDDEEDDALQLEGDESLQPEKPEDAVEESTTTDQSLGGVQEGETGGDGSADSAAQVDAKSNQDESKQSGQRGQDLQSLDATENEPIAEAQDVDMKDETAQDESQAQAPSNAGTGPAKERADASAPGEQPQFDAASREQHRSLGDALQQWQRRLDAIPDLHPDEEQQPQNAADMSESKQTEGEVGFVQEGDEQEHDEQALGPAGEEQVQALENLRLGEEELEPSFEPDAMDQDLSALAAPAPQATTVNLTGSSLAEADAKAVPANDARDETLGDTQRDTDVIDMERDDDHLTSAPLPHALDPDLNEKVEQAMLQWRSGEDDEHINADGVWRMYETLTRDLSFALTEQLRLILEPTLATRLKGDYRSGKRLNLKKIIPYIASEFTKDKIWLRRTRPSQREYQVMISIDDSKSMADSHSVHLAFQSLALIARSLTRLEVGGVSISKFGDSMDVLHDFDQGPVSEDVGAKLLERFTFSQRTTDVRLLVEQSLTHLARARETARSGKSSLNAGDLWQLEIIISDGMCQDHDKLRALLRRAAEQKVMFVFVVIDSLHRRADGDAATRGDVAASDSSILAMKSVSYSKGADGRLELKMKRYIDDFPFDMFVVLRDVDALPDVLSATLRQFFEKCFKSARRNASNGSPDTAKPSQSAQADEQDPQRVSDATRYTSLAAVWLGVFLGALDTTSTSGGQFAIDEMVSRLIALAVLPKLEPKKLSPHSYGRLADIIGRRYASLTSLTMFTIGTFGCGVSPSLTWLIVSRCVAGMGGGGMMAVSSIIASDLVPLKRRGLTQGIANLFYGLGAGLGGPVGGWISDRIGWRASFLGQVPLLIIALVLVYWKIRYVIPGQGKSKLEMAKRIDYFGSLTLIGALVTLLLSMSFKNNDSLPWSDSRVWALAAASVVFWIVFILIEGFWVGEPVLPLQLLQERNGIFVSIACFATSFVTFSGLYFLPMHYEIVRSMTSSVAGAHLVPNSIALSAGSLFAGWMIRKTGGYYWLLVITSSFPVFSLAILSTLDEHSPAWLEWVSIVPSGFGFASVLTCTLIALIASVDRSDMATATGLSYLTRYVGQVIGVACSSSLLQSVLSARLHDRIKDGRWPSFSIEKVIEKIRHVSTSISKLPPDLQRAARTSYHDALRAVFLLNMAMAAICFVSTWFLKEFPLPGSFEEEERQRQQRLNNGGSTNATAHEGHNE